MGAAYKIESNQNGDLNSNNLIGKRDRLERWIRHNSQWIAYSAKLLIAGILSAYLVLSINYSLEGSIPLLVFGALIVVYITWYLVYHLQGLRIAAWYHEVLNTRITVCWNVGRIVWYALVTVGTVVFLGVDVGRENPWHLVSLSGVAFFIAVSFIFSTAPAKVPWRTVYMGVIAQFVLGLVVLRWDAGNDAITWVANQIVAFVNYGQNGAKFVFGATYEEHYFAMALMPVLVWFSAITQVLLYLGIIQVFVKILGGLLYFCVGTSPAEAFVAVSNIFLGPEASVLMIKDSLGELSLSQLHTVMSCGLASIDAGMFTIYESFGIPARHLLSASCMSAPAAMLLSKTLLPDTDQHSHRTLALCKPKGANIFAIFAKGARDSIGTIAGILSVLMAFVSLLAFVNTTVTWMGDRAGIEDLTLEKMLGYILMPVVFLMGVVWEDCALVGQLIGTKTIINEFVAYTDLAVLIENRKQGIDPSISPRSELIAAYALCGFSNLGSVGMQIGFLSSLIPDRQGDISRMALRSLVASSFACLMTACMAGLLAK